MISESETSWHGVDDAKECTIELTSFLWHMPDDAINQVACHCSVCEVSK